MNLLSDHKQGVTCLTMMPDGNLVSASSDCHIKIWDPASICMTTMSCTHAQDTPAEASHDIARKLEPPKCMYSFDCGSYMTGVAILPKGHLVSCGSNSTVRVWNVKTGERLSTLEADAKVGILYSLAVL